MKILLIAPNVHSIYYRSIPLGLLYVAASLRSAGFREIKIIDSKVRNLSHKEIAQGIKDFAPDLIGISAMSIEGPEAHEVACLAKGIYPQCKVVIGGAYATSSPEFILKDVHVDFAVMGEGERTACELVSALANENDFSGISGLAFRKNNVAVINPRTTVIEDVDSLPFPAWDLIDMEKYFYCGYRHSENSVPASDRIAPLFTSRGCSFGCVFCHNVFGKRVRLRSAENVVDEIAALVDGYGVRELEIVDDIFNSDVPRAKRICDEIIRRDIKINLSFPNGLRVDLMDEELVAKLRRAGTRVIFYAIESGSPDVQKRIRKNLDLEKAERMIRYTVQQGIVTGCYFMLGFPNETKAEMLQTVRLAMKLPLHLADFFYVTPRPNTPLHEQLKREHPELKEDMIYQYHVLSFNASSVPDNELKKLRSGAYRGFYFRLSQMWRIWKSVPNKKVLFWQAYVMLRRSITGTGVF